MGHYGGLCRPAGMNYADWYFASLSRSRTILEMIGAKRNRQSDCRSHFSHSHWRVCVWPLSMRAPSRNRLQQKTFIVNWPCHSNDAVKLIQKRNVECAMSLSILPSQIAHLIEFICFHFESSFREWCLLFTVFFSSSIRRKTERSRQKHVRFVFEWIFGQNARIRSVRIRLMSFCFD